MTVLLYALGVLLFAVGVALSIGLHELGHLIPGKLFGVKTTQYFIGFGPTVWSTKRGETEYGVKAVPFGGFVGIGATVAVGLWLYLLHVLVLVGYALTLRIEDRGGIPWHRVVDKDSHLANAVSHDPLPGSTAGATRVRPDR